MANKAIGVFDSGFGGLDILKEIVKQLPNYNYVYLGDSKRAPYGNRSQVLIYKFTEQAVDFLFKRNCQLIILACNTASSKALRKIQQNYLPKHYPNKRVLGVIIPTVEVAIKVTKNNCIGVIGTKGTVSSLAFVKEINKLNPAIKVLQRACAALVPIVEAGEHNSVVLGNALKSYLPPIINKNIDTLILGCTHYGFLQDKIKKFVGDDISLVWQGKIVAEKLKDYLYRHPEIENTLSKQAKIEFLTTDLTNNFKTLGSQFFGKQIYPKKVKIG